MHSSQNTVITDPSVETQPVYILSGSLLATCWGLSSFYRS